jgi:hypothetical protein
MGVCLRTWLTPEQDRRLSRVRDAIGWQIHSYTKAARLLGLNPNYLHRLIRTLDMKSILEPDR